MHSIQLGDVKVEYPSQMDEMTPDQYIGFCDYLLQYMSGQISYVKFKLDLVYLFLNLKRTVDIRRSKQSKVVENLVKLSDLNESFFEDDPGKENVKRIKQGFVKNILPEIVINGEYFHGPSDALTNTCFGEYTSALNYFIDFAHDQDEEDLNGLCAVLYRPKRYGKHADKRVVFNEDKIELYKEQFKKVPKHIKYGVWLWFSACQNFIVTSNELVLSGGAVADLSVLFKKSESTSNDYNVGMAGVIFDLAETRVFGDVEKTKMQNTYEVLIQMSRTYFKAKKQKQNASNT